VTRESASREESNGIIERGEEGDSQSAVRHGIQETVARGSNEEIHPRGEPTEGGRSSPKFYEQHSACQESREEKRVRESAVTPEVAVLDAESEAKHVYIGNYRAARPDNPNSFWRAWAVEAGAYAEGRDRM
jgi:hypothetical protein